MGEREVYQPRERGKEILEIPAAVGFAGKGGNLVTLGETFRGSLHVASRLLSYGYLWNDIRVQGGAYGTKLQVFPDGDILFTTYRDPNPCALPRFLRWCSPGSERFLRQQERPSIRVLSAPSPVQNRCVAPEKWENRRLSII